MIDISLGIFVHSSPVRIFSVIYTCIRNLLGVWWKMTRIIWHTLESNECISSPAQCVCVIAGSYPPYPLPPRLPTFPGTFQSGNVELTRWESQNHPRPRPSRPRTPAITPITLAGRRESTVRIRKRRLRDLWWILSDLKNRERYFPILWRKKRYFF